MKKRKFRHPKVGDENVDSQVVFFSDVNLIVNFETWMDCFVHVLCQQVERSHRNYC